MDIVKEIEGLSALHGTGGYISRLEVLAILARYPFERIAGRLAYLAAKSIDDRYSGAEAAISRELHALIKPVDPIETRVREIAAQHLVPLSDAAVASFAAYFRDQLSEPRS